MRITLASATQKPICLSIASRSVTQSSSSVTLCQLMLTKLMHNPHYELEISVFFITR